MKMRKAIKECECVGLFGTRLFSAAAFGVFHAYVNFARVLGRSHGGRTKSGSVAQVMIAAP